MRCSLIWELFDVIRRFLHLLSFLCWALIVIEVVFKAFKIQFLIFARRFILIVNVLVHKVRSPLFDGAIFHKGDTLFAVDDDVKDLLVVKFIHLFGLISVPLLPICVAGILFVTPPVELVSFGEANGEAYAASYLFELNLCSIDNFW